MKRTPILSKLAQTRGITFIEVMLTLAIFSIGFVAIFSTFFSSLERIERMTQRIYAHTFLDNRISEIERILRVQQALPLEMNRKTTADIGFKKIDFNEDLKISAVEDYADVFQVDLKFAWKDKDHDYQLSRSAYISDPEYIKP